MSDPAYDAAHRAGEGLVRTGSVLAAREALMPIRELHQPKWLNCINACCSGEECRNRTRYCSHCEFDWPCDTATLVYTSDELT